MAAGDRALANQVRAGAGAALSESARLPSCRFLHTPWKAPADVLARASVQLGVTYPHRIIEDLAAARRITVPTMFPALSELPGWLTCAQVESLLDARRSALHMNDAGGYDLIVLPSGRITRVFTKEEFRLGSDGTVKSLQAAQSKSQRSTSKFKSAKKAGAGRGAAAAGKRGGGSAGERGDDADASLSHNFSQVTECFGKDPASVAQGCQAPLLGRDGAHAGRTRAGAGRRGRGANKALVIGT